jgi:hypothetical protein
MQYKRKVEDKIKNLEDENRKKEDREMAVRLVSDVILILL